jgi:hypothetical protein
MKVGPLKVVCVIVVAIWMAYVARMLYLVQRETEQACTYSRQVRDNLGKPPGFNSDVIVPCN